MDFIISPGATIYNLTEKLGGWSWSKLGVETGLGAYKARNLLYDSEPITEEIAIALEKAFKNFNSIYDIVYDKEYWLNKAKQYKERKDNCIVVNTKILEELEEYGFCKI